MTSPDDYRTAIEDYIAQRPPAPPWPDHPDKRGAWAIRNPLSIPDIAGLPANCLPLFTVTGFGTMLSVYGILADTHILETAVALNKKQLVAEVFETYPSLNAYFMELIRKVSGLEVIDRYARIVAELRSKYPNIADLLTDPPEIPPEVRDKWNFYSAYIL